MRGTLLASLALAVPYVAAHPTKAQGSSLSKRSVDLDAFRPKIESVYSDKNLVEETPLARRDPKPEILARNQVRRTAPGSDFRLVESYTGTNGVTHFYYKQTFNGVDVAFGDFNVNVSIPTVETLQDHVLTEYRLLLMARSSLTEALSSRSLCSLPRARPRRTPGTL